MPDNINVAKGFLEKPLPDNAQIIVLENAHGKKVTYKFIEAQAEYEGHPCKLAVVYSDALEKYGSRMFKCQADGLLKEYKTQSDVEKRFKVLKSPTYMNSLFLKTPHRVEALVYLLLIALMMLTVAERVVQDELKNSGDVVYDIDNRKQKQPTFSTILKIMDRVRVVTYLSNGKIIRKIRNIDESCRKIIGFLQIPESCFAWNESSYSSE